eukprot:sb/3478721/
MPYNRRLNFSWIILSPKSCIISSPSFCLVPLRLKHASRGECPDPAERLLNQLVAADLHDLPSILPGSPDQFKFKFNTQRCVRPILCCIHNQSLPGNMK